MRVLPPQHLRVQAVPGQPTRRVAVDEDIESGQCLAHLPLRPRLLQVERHGGLSGVVPEKRHPDVTGQRRLPDHRVALRRLKLHHLHAQVAEHAAAERGGLAADLQGPVALKRAAAWHCTHLRSGVG